MIKSQNVDLWEVFRHNFFERYNTPYLNLFQFPLSMLVSVENVGRFDIHKKVV